MNKTALPGYLFYIGLAVYFAGAYYDHWKSSRQVAYGTTEGRGLNADKYGIYSPAKYWAWHLIWAVAVTVVFFAMGGNEGLFGLGLIIFGGIKAFQGYRDSQKQERSRAKQILALRAVKEANINPYDYEQVGLAIHRAVGGQTPIIKGGRGRLEDFAWWYVEPLEASPQSNIILYEKVLPKVWELSQKPESDWFKDTTQRKVN